MRGRSTETKYGRIPLWLYEADVSLQAIATYGWLHGKYGHYDRVMPSYGTLAKELGVSRGSVITYVKALMAVGALRIETSGAADHRSNTYAIAFNEPFPVEAQVAAGQSADQSIELVSRLTRTGQPADQAGQPVEHEEDVLNQTGKTLSLPSQRRTRKTPPAPPTDEREKILSPDTAMVLKAYATALGRPVSPATATKLIQQVDDHLAAGFPAWWLADRARELAAHGWSDLAKHCDRSTVPVTRKPADSKSDWCGQCSDPNHRTRKDPARDNELVPCPDCHPAAVARRRRTEPGAAA